MTNNDPTQLARLEESLRQRRRFLKAELWTHMHQGEAGEMAVPNHAGEGSDHAAADLQADIELKTLSNEMIELGQIDAALQQIGSGHYGVCCECGEDIAVERLVAQPAATRCLLCQQQLERRTDGAHHATL